MYFKECSYLRYQMSDWEGVWIKMWHFKWKSDLYWQIKIEYCRHVTHSPWSCHILLIVYNENDEERNIIRSVRSWATKLTTCRSGPRGGGGGVKITGNYGVGVQKTLPCRILKDLMPITFSPPRAKPEVVYFFLYQMKAHIFLIANLKYQLQVLCSFRDITISVKLDGKPENNFLCIFKIASSPGVHTFFCLWRVNKKLSQGENSQNASPRSRSIN